MKSDLLEALELANAIIEYVGFDAWEMECLGESLKRFSDIYNKYFPIKEKPNVYTPYSKYCKVCNKWFSVEQGYESHLLGKKHIKKAKETTENE